MKLKTCIPTPFPYSTSQLSQEDREERMFVRRFTRRVWARTWCLMLRYNIFACARETRESVRRPRPSKTGPYPRWGTYWDEEANHTPHRRLEFHSIGTLETPLVVGPLPPKGDSVLRCEYRLCNCSAAVAGACSAAGAGLVFVNWLGYAVGAVKKRQVAQVARREPR